MGDGFTLLIPKTHQPHFLFSSHFEFHFSFPVYGHVGIFFKIQHHMISGLHVQVKSQLSVFLQRWHTCHMFTGRFTEDLLLCWFNIFHGLQIQQFKTDMTVKNAVHHIKLSKQERVELTSQGVATLLDAGYRSMLNTMRGICYCHYRPQSPHKKLECHQQAQIYRSHLIGIHVTNKQRKHYFPFLTKV